VFLKAAFVRVELFSNVDIRATAIARIALEVFFINLVPRSANRQKFAATSAKTNATKIALHAKKDAQSVVFILFVTMHALKCVHHAVNPAQSQDATYFALIIVSTHLLWQSDAAQLDFVDINASLSATTTHSTVFCTRTIIARNVMNQYRRNFIQ